MRITGRWFVLSGLFAAIVFATVYGLAASLGASTGGLAAGSSPVASCGSGMTFAYTTAFYPGSSGYVVDGIDLSNIPSGCQGKSLSVTFYGSGTTPTGSPVDGRLPMTGTTERITVDPTANAIDAREISGVSVVVS